MDVLLDARPAERVQVFTPPALAVFMAKELLAAPAESISLLDPGAGAGALTEAVVDAAGTPVTATLVEQDELLASHLEEFLGHGPSTLLPTSEVVHADFIDAAAFWKREGRTFTHAILNPPYQRISARSSERRRLDVLGVQAPNMFAAFLWMTADLLCPGGTMVAVVPRSLLSGTQFMATRRHLSETGSIFRLHHFSSRKDIFERDAVQQEVVVIGFQKSAELQTISFSRSVNLVDLSEETVHVSRDRILGSSDERVVLVPATLDAARTNATESEPLLPDGVNVSVGSVVDFRTPEVVSRIDGHIPLIGSEEFGSRRREARGLLRTAKSEAHILPPGKYIIIRRISPPEANPRLQVKLIKALDGEFEHGVAFENHVLFLHSGRQGIADDLCGVLIDRLTSASAQRQIMERSGSTQVNVADILALNVNG